MLGKKKKTVRKTDQATEPIEVTTQPLTPGRRPPRFTILPDHPIAGEQDENTAGFEARLSSVLDIVRHRDTVCPIAIALYGDWGTGKTSAMKWLEHQLNGWNELKPQERGEKKNNPDGKTAPHPRVYSVWFEPWKYSKREDVWRGLIAEIILQCTSRRQQVSECN